jgi:dolichol-phosphate mannosyltransferase
MTTDDVTRHGSPPIISRLSAIRFVAFGFVGIFGAAVHFAVLTLLLRLHQCTFIQGQAIATLCAMTVNFSINNVLTPHDRQLHGSRWWRGLLSFTAICSAGGLLSVGVAFFIHELNPSWVLAAMSGVLVGAVWNYVGTQKFTWGRASEMS